MNPCEMNIAIASLSNFLYCELDKDDFECLALFLNELSKSMFTMAIHERLCTNGDKSNKEKRAENDDLAEDIAVAGAFDGI